MIVTARRYRDLTNPNYRAVELETITVCEIQLVDGSRMWVPDRDVKRGMYPTAFVLRRKRAGTDAELKAAMRAIANGDIDAMRRYGLIK